MNYLDIKNVKSLNIEHTSLCNLKCPQCARNVNGKLNPQLYFKTMGINDYKRILPSSFCKQLESVLFCGSYGDAMADPHFLDCIKYLRSNNITLSIFTNGSLRSTNWWKSLAQILSNKCRVIFAIDGLKNSNHIYRINANFDNIMKNAKTFIDSGGNATWDYLVFSHNKHQIEEARKVASGMGFKIFNEKKTKRFIDNNHYKSSKGSGEFGKLIKKYGSWENYIDKTIISCVYQKMATLYIDFELNLWPCCWVGAPLFFDGNHNIQRNQVYKLLDKYGHGFNSLINKSIEEILNHPWYTNDLVNSWLGKTSKNKKLMTCGRTCGAEYKFSSGDNSNRKKGRL